jgi:ankyrin repeat protein
MADEITPANFAHWIASGRSDMVRNFIQRGADVNAMEATSRDYPLHCAAKSSHWEAFGLLLDAGAKPNPRDWQGATPLKLIAGRKAHVASLDLPTLVAARRLLDKGADPTAASADTMTPLHVATANRFDPMVRLLVESGAAINAEAVEEGFLGLTPTQIADDHDYAEIAAFLRSKGGKTNATFVAKRAAQRAYIKLIGPFLYQ